MPSHDAPGPTYLPDADGAFIEDAKLAMYLLDVTHPNGGPKARFFLAHGYQVNDHATLRADLLTHGRTHPVAMIRRTPHGMRYTVDGTLVTPNGLTRQIRTVWQVDTGTDVPRLVTAYPDD